MAQDDAGDKTEQPTARRREEAREEGQIARSADLTAAIALLAGLLLLKALGPRMFDTLLGMTRALGEAPAIDAGGLLPWIRRIGLAGLEMLGPYLGLLVAITIAGTAAQSGLLLTWSRLSIKPDRIDPVAGTRRLLSGDALTRLLVGLLKVGIVALVAYFTIRGKIGVVLSAGALHTAGIFDMSARLLFDLAVRLGLALLILGIIDYLLQRWKLERQLRMTKQEVRDELKKMEGDPLIKQRRRQLQARLALQRIRAEVPKADVIVTNPTEFAVALKYDQAVMTAPRVIAKGKDFLAARIREIAQLHGVPVVQRPPLARALYAGVEVGHEVPPAFYRAVAELLAYVYQLTGRKAG
jgi:flagellar biosynthesis protein FlhB